MVDKNTYKVHRRLIVPPESDREELGFAPVVE